MSIWYVIAAYSSSSQEKSPLKILISQHQKAWEYFQKLEKIIRSLGKLLKTWGNYWKRRKIIKSVGKFFKAWENSLNVGAGLQAAQRTVKKHKKLEEEINNHSVVIDKVVAR